MAYVFKRFVSWPNDKHISQRCIQGCVTIVDNVKPVKETMVWSFNAAAQPLCVGDVILVVI